MAKKRKTLPKNFDELIKEKDLAALKAVFDVCEINANNGYSKQTALHMYDVPDELVRWLAEQGADMNARSRYGDTPLHQQAIWHCGNIALLLELGADLEARNHTDDTPLHLAAGFSRAHQVQALLAHGADVHAENDGGRTPLGYCLIRCANTDITDAAAVAGLLLDAGAKITPEMTESVERIGKKFEFYRADFNKDYLAETEAGLARLYELFHAVPAAKRQMHDDVSLIAVPDGDWDEQHDALWQQLVPGRGTAKTVQGEVIRISGRLAREIMDNGSANWCADFRKMLDALVKRFGTGTPLAADELEEAAGLAKLLRDGNGDDEPERLMELAVRWVQANPVPVPMDKPEYDR
ncbi:MAG: ankyrin repeat domain-containing protein [Clostridiales Family XIII bacterium]|jgi:hypothetical protein|nr:ankyrin repeat domain-containing protein [Clostridiales Family XIII bacterium]